ncbi:hypothetical protein KUCAC02_010966, partial [Chaenocephalus aceratus]
RTASSSTCGGWSWASFACLPLMRKLPPRSTCCAKFARKSLLVLWIGSPETG